MYVWNRGFGTPLATVASSMRLSRAADTRSADSPLDNARYQNGPAAGSGTARHHHFAEAAVGTSLGTSQGPGKILPSPDQHLRRGPNRALREPARVGRDHPWSGLGNLTCLPLGRVGGTLRACAPRASVTEVRRCDRCAPAIERLVRDGTAVARSDSSAQSLFRVAPEFDGVPASIAGGRGVGARSVIVLAWIRARDYADSWSASGSVG